MNEMRRQVRPGRSRGRRIAARALPVVVAVALGGCVGAGARPSTVPASSPAVALPTAVVATGASAAADRVPPGLAGIAWVAWGPGGEVVAGTTGAPGRLRLAGSERPLAVGDGLLATVVSSPEAGVGSRVVIRTLPEGRAVATADLPEEVLVGAFAGGSLVVGGHLPGTTGRDPGLAAISVADGSVRRLIEPAELQGWDGDVARTVGISRSGRTIVSGTCIPERCALDLVDAASGGVRRIVDAVDAFPGIVTDEVVVIGDAESTWIAGLDLATGERRWGRGDGEFQHGYATPDGLLVQAIARPAEGTFSLELIDPVTGSGRPVIVRDVAEGLALWPELSSGRTAVVGTGATFADAAIGGAPVSAAAVDLETGALSPGAVTLDLGS